MVYCTEFLDGWWSWGPLCRSSVRCGGLGKPSAPYTRPTQRLSRPPPIQKLCAENHMLQLNIQCSWWWAYVPETCRAKNRIKLSWCIKLAFKVISWGRCTVKQPSRRTQSQVFSTKCESRLFWPLLLSLLSVLQTNNIMLPSSHMLYRALWWWILAFRPEVLVLNVGRVFERQDIIHIYPSWKTTINIFVFSQKTIFYYLTSWRKVSVIRPSSGHLYIKFKTVYL